MVTQLQDPGTKETTKDYLLALLGWGNRTAEQPQVAAPLERVVDAIPEQAAGTGNLQVHVAMERATKPEGDMEMPGAEEGMGGEAESPVSEGGDSGNKRKLRTRRESERRCPRERLLG